MPVRKGPAFIVRLTKLNKGKAAGVNPARRNCGWYRIISRVHLITSAKRCPRNCDRGHIKQRILEKYLFENALWGRFDRC